MNALLFVIFFVIGVSLSALNFEFMYHCEWV